MDYFKKLLQLGPIGALIKVHRRIDHKVRLFFHLPVRLKSKDREILDNKILPWFAEQKDIKRILFVGCEYYTLYYPDIFTEAEFWTIEPDPAKSKYGSKNHIVGYLQDLCQFVLPGSYDLIIFNGVYGWGLNNFEDIEKSFSACFDCLRNGGYLVFGWNNIPERTPVPLENIQALRLFRPFVISGVGGWRIQTNSHNLHVFDLYRKVCD